MASTENQERIAAASKSTPTTDHKEHIAEDVNIERVLSPSDGLDKAHINYDRVDPDVAKYASQAAVEISEADNKRLKRMIDKRVLTVMVFTYFLQALDKGTMSFASIMNLPEDLGLHGQQYSWLTTCIYLAVLIVEYPTNYLIQRLPVAKYLGTSVVLWGATLALHAACTNFASILAVRTLLGIFEAVCQPSFLILSSMWYKRSEQAQTVTLWYMMNGGQQIVGGLLAYCFSLLHSGPLTSWQAIFITYGTLSVFWGLFVLSYLPDSPMRAHCFSESDKTLMVERVRSNQTGLQNRIWRKYQFVEAFKDPQMYCYGLIQICTTLPTSGLGAFANIIISGFNFTVLQTQLLSMVLGAFIITILLSSNWLVKKTGQNLLVMGVYVVPCFVGTTVLMTVRNTDTATKAGLLVSYYIVLSFWAAQALALSMISRNVAGQTKKSVVVAVNFVCWSAGNAIGPQVFLSWDAPRYFIAFATHMGCYGLLVFIIIYLRFHLKRQNSLKDSLPNSHSHDNIHAFEDLTDRENASFRYVY